MRNASKTCINKYKILIKILDELSGEAPTIYKRYHPPEGDNDALNKSRSLAYIHLFLKVKFGLTEFMEREKWITDGSYDGGIDAYYVSEENRTVYFIQSKFRTNPENFVNKQIDLEEILLMDIDRITDGEDHDEEGNKYNGKILGLQRTLGEVADIARYSYKVIILANLSTIKPSRIKKLTDQTPAEVFDFMKCYDELVFPVVCGTHFEESDLFIDINLANKDYSSSRISYPVVTKNSECEITILFVSTLEVARVMYRYKNSILKFNPRSYLDISSNAVNKEIRKTITDMNTNEFSLFNNGITMLSDETDIKERIGKKGKGQLHIKNPQIINGGQTAYTLSKVYSDTRENPSYEKIFEGKEVMLKIITFTSDGIKKDKVHNKKVLSLIEDISIATNQQSVVVEADRRSNDRIQIELQDLLYKRHGFFYERKRGEFFDGLSSGYIAEEKIIDRSLFFRLCCSVEGMPKEARRSSDNVLFKKEFFDGVLNDVNKVDLYFFSYLCYLKLDSIQKKLGKSKNKYGQVNYGQGLRYGKYAIVSAISRSLKENITEENVYELVDTMVVRVLSVWRDFEKYVVDQYLNIDYFFSYEENDSTYIEKNFDGYYKGKTINIDIPAFFEDLDIEIKPDEVLIKEADLAYEL